jgi:hypothetical protein
MLLANNSSINTPMTAPATGAVTVLQSGNDKELLWVDEQIKAILPPRVGVSDGFINSLLDPIKYVKAPKPLGGAGGLLAPPKLGGGIIPLNTPPKIVEEPLRLQALMNKSALINGKWYKANDPIRNYSLSEIKSNSVLLSSKKGQPLLLMLTKTNNNIKLNTK